MKKRAHNCYNNKVVYDFVATIRDDISGKTQNRIGYTTSCSPDIQSVAIIYQISSFYPFHFL